MAKTGRDRSDFFYTVFGRAIQIAVGLCTLRVQTTYLSRQEMGEYGLFINIATLLVFVAIRPLLQYFSRRLNEWFRDGGLRQALKKVVAIEFALGLASIPIIALCAVFYSVESKSPLLLWATVAGGWFFFYSLFNTIVPALNLLGYKSQWVTANSAGVVSGLAVAWLIMLAVPTAINWTLGITLGFAVGTIIAGAVLWRFVAPTPSSQPGPVAPLSFLVPATIAVGGIWIQFQALRLLSADFMPLTEYGLFTAGYGLAAGIMAAFEGLAAQYLQPYFYANLSQTADPIAQGRHWSNFAGTMTVLTTGSLFMSAIFGSLLCKILLSGSFQGAWPYFLIGMLMESLRVISGGISLGTHVTLQVQRSLRSYIAGILALALGMLAGKIFHDFSAFAAVVIAGCVIHLAIIIYDVCHHLNVKLALPAIRPLVGLFFAMVAYFACVWQGMNIAAITAMAASTALFMTLVLQLNTHFLKTQ